MSNYSNKSNYSDNYYYINNSIYFILLQNHTHIRNMVYNIDIQ